MDSPRFKIILTYKLAGEDLALQVVMGKTYTFESLAQEISDTLNINDEQVIDLYHLNGKVM